MFAIYDYIGNTFFRMRAPIARTDKMEIVDDMYHRPFGLSTGFCNSTPVSVGLLSLKIISMVNLIHKTQKIRYQKIQECIP